jgi:hypothetical protein
VSLDKLVRIVLRIVAEGGRTSASA